MTIIMITVQIIMIKWWTLRPWYIVMVMCVDNSWRWREDSFWKQHQLHVCLGQESPHEGCVVRFAQTPSGRCNFFATIRQAHAHMRTHCGTHPHNTQFCNILPHKGAGRCREPPNRCAVVAAAFALRCDHLHARGQVARWISLDSLGMIARYWTCWPYYIILLCIQILDTNCSYSICAASRVAAIVASGAGTVVVSWYLPGGWDMMCYKYPAVWIESSDILLLCILDVSLIPLHRGGVHHNNYIYTRDNQHILRAPRIQLRNWLADSAAVSIAGPGPCLPANYRSKDSSIHSDYAGGIHWQCNLQ